MKFVLIVFALVVVSGVSFVGCASFGTRPKEEDKSRFKESKHYNASEGMFENRRPNLIKEMKKRTLTWSTFREFFKSGTDRVPAQRMPEIRPDMDEFLMPSEELKVIWFGHSSFLLNMDGKIVLVDPVFSGAASPISFMVKRFQRPVLELSELPKIDYIIISHDHYDHLDMESIKFFAGSDTQFVVPLGVGSHLRGWGVDSQKIVERDWWQEANFYEIDFIATPAQHFSGRNGIHENETLWASWVLKSKNHKVYFSGDSGYDTHFKEIGDKFGPFDIAFIESGQYNKKWEEVHLLPEQGLAAFRDLRAQKYFPVHWGMFELSTHPWYEPVEYLFEFSQNLNFDLVVPRLGQIVSPNRVLPVDKWWRD